MEDRRREVLFERDDESLEKVSPAEQEGVRLSESGVEAEDGTHGSGVLVKNAATCPMIGTADENVLNIEPTPLPIASSRTSSEAVNPSCSVMPSGEEGPCGSAVDRRQHEHDGNVGTRAISPDSNCEKGLAARRVGGREARRY